MSDNTAILAGFTKEITANHADVELHLLVKPDTDYDTRFKAYCMDECEWVVVSGWQFDIEEA